MKRSALLLSMLIAATAVAQDAPHAEETAVLETATTLPATMPTDNSDPATQPAEGTGEATAASADPITPVREESDWRRDNTRRSGRGGSTRNEIAYASLVEVVRAKSIFSKDRRPQRSWNRGNDYVRPTPSSNNRPQPRLPVLVGVGRHPDDLVAIIEVPGEGVLELRPGDMLPNDLGYIAAITLDEIEIATSPSGPFQQVEVGQNLRGGAPQVLSTTATSDVSSPESATSSSGSTDGDDLLSRMRRRRMQEMNR